MQAEKTVNARQISQITVRLSVDCDEKILAEFFYDWLNVQQERRVKIKEVLLNFNFIRKKILQFYSKEILRHWDKLLFWMISDDEKEIGFSAISWSDGKDKSAGRATIHDIYLLPEFRGKKIENYVVTKFYEFCDENNLRLGFSVNPEWGLFEEEK